MVVVVVPGDERSQNEFWFSVSSLFSGLGNDHAIRNNANFAFRRLGCSFHQRVQHFRWVHNYDSPCKCYDDCSIGLYQPIRQHVNGGHLPRVACLRDVSAHYDGRSVVLQTPPFLAHTHTCIATHPEIKGEGSSYSKPPTLHGAYYHCLCITAILPTKH